MMEVNCVKILVAEDDIDLNKIIVCHGDGSLDTFPDSWGRISLSTCGLIERFDELAARIRAVTRTASKNPTNVYVLADLTLDTQTHAVARGGKSINLTAREFMLLEYLVRNKNRVLSRQKIEDSVWSYDYEGGTNVVDVYISYLRKKIDEGFDQKLIHTVYGIGYCMREKT